MFNFFRRKKTQPDTKKGSVAPNTSISYDPELITRLKNDHQQLLSIYQKINTAATQDNYSKVSSLLSEFRSLFHSHILLENVRLYIYLKHVLATDVDSAEVAAEMKKGMGAIGKSVNQFIIKYTVEEWTEAKKYSFSDEFKNIGAALVKRINLEEESLYTLYYPPENY